PSRGVATKIHSRARPCVDHAFSRRRLSEPPKAIHAHRIDRRIYLQLNATYYEPLRIGAIMSVRKKIVVTNGEPVTWWLADYSDGAGKRHQRRFPTKKEALQHHDKTKTAIRAGQHVSLPSDLTMAGAADKWLAKIAADDRERSTLRQYQ